jgi:hypothetical protein
MGKAAGNEDHKLRATYQNNISVGLAVGGVFIPYLVLTQRVDELFTWAMDTIQNGKAVISVPAAIKLSFTVFSFFMAMYVSRMFRRLATNEIKKIKD